MVFFWGVGPVELARTHEKAKEPIIHRHAVGHEARPLKEDCLEPEGRGSETENLLGSEHHRHHAVHAADSNHSSSSQWVGLREGDHNTDRPRKRFSGLLPLDTLDVMRESARLLRRHSDLLTTLTAVLICPISIIILTHVLVTHKLIDWLALRIEISVLGGSPAIEFHTPHMKFIYQKLSDFCVTSVVSFPLTVSMDCLAKASVVYTVASTYAGLKVTFGDILHRVVPRVWIRLAVTYTFCCVLFLAWGVVVILGIGFLNGVFVALDVPSVIAFVLLCSIGALCGGIFLFGRILLDVATVACALEDLTGWKALVRTFFLIQGRMQVAAWSLYCTSWLYSIHCAVICIPCHRF
ncbi:hypothetical protein R1sor_017296 [Riccia sorocarpa]|uniref:Uncharacterized protein n=1 Tax=Riccia sorocarpa TaxID=122646 RepID=A0ABD3ICM5_9MARC